MTQGREQLDRTHITQGSSVIPAEAVIQGHLGMLDPGFRRGDEACISTARTIG
jgi:hypothetical protein